jgi:hypothetical protein
LETDIIKMDVGLSGVNPRVLARGEERDTDFVGKLLCWLGQKSGTLPLAFEGTVTRSTTGAVGVDGVPKEEDDEDEDVLAKLATTLSHRTIPIPESEQQPRPPGVP